MRRALLLVKSCMVRSVGRREPLKGGEADVAQGAARRRSRRQTLGSRIVIEEKEPPKGALQAWGLLWFLGICIAPVRGLLNVLLTSLSQGSLRSPWATSATPAPRAQNSSPLRTLSLSSAVRSTLWIHLRTRLRRANGLSQHRSRPACPYSQAFPRSLAARAVWKTSVSLLHILRGFPYAENAVGLRRPARTMNSGSFKNV